VDALIGYEIDEDDGKDMLALRKRFRHAAADPFLLDQQA
jgi:hypothetical protein